MSASARKRLAEMGYAADGSSFVRRELATIDSSLATSRALTEAAGRLEDIAADNEIVRDEVRRLLAMADEYKRDADERETELMRAASEAAR